MNDRFLRACRRQPVDCTPVWFMRQAGRYMAEYRALRQRYSLLEICRAAGAGRRRHAAAGRCHRGRRRDPVLRSAAALHADGARIRFHQRRRAVDRTSDPQRRRRRSPSHFRAARGARPRARDDPAAAPRADRSRAAHRVWRRAVHAGRVRDRRRAFDQLRSDQGVHVRAAARLAPALRALSRR